MKSGLLKRVTVLTTISMIAALVMPVRAVADAGLPTVYAEETNLGITENVSPALCEGNLLKEGTGHIADGKCGEDVYWSLDEEGSNVYKLIITGNGDMYDYGLSNKGPEWVDHLRGLGKITLVIKDGVTSIGNAAFFSCDRITDVEIPGSVTSIGDSAFAYCDRITSITIPDGVTKIGDNAFDYCMNLTDLTISDSVTRIGKEAFENCLGLTGLTLSESLRGIGEKAFFSCYGLTKVTIPQNVTLIGDDAFDYYFLQEVENKSSCEASLPSIEGLYWYNKEDKTRTGITAIADGVAVRSDNTLPEIRNGQCGENAYWSVTGDDINGYVITISGNGAMYDCADFDESKKLEFRKFGMLRSRLIVEDGINSIGAYSFSGCKGLASITISDSVTSIGENAFSYCYDLKNMVIPGNVRNVGDYAFEECLNLSEVTIAKGVKSIGKQAFNGCRLKSVMIPESVSEIGDNLFGGNYSLSNVTIPDSLTKLGGTFAYCYNLTNVTIPDSVTEIGDYTFLACDGLTSVVIPDSVKNIGEEAFSGCNGLASVSIPSGVKSIGIEAFKNCWRITEINIPNSVTSIGEYAFDDCKGLKSISIPESVKNLGGYIISGCVNITEATNNSVCYLDLPEVTGMYWYSKTDTNNTKITKIAKGVAVRKADSSEPVEKEETGDTPGGGEGKTDITPSKSGHDVVPLTKGGILASHNDNYGPEAGSGKINKQVLDFSNVGKNSVSSDDLKLTVIKGSRFTTADKIKSIENTDPNAIKTKINKNTGAAIITPLRSGRITIITDSDKKYTVSFTVETPKVQKAVKNQKINSSGEIVLSIDDMFKTSIDGGKIDAVSKTGQSITISGNSVVFTPKEKDKIKITYQFLNKKYKTTIMVK